MTPKHPLSSGSTALSAPEALALLDRMLLIRAFEEAASDLYSRSQIGGLLHLAIGQEAVAVGAASVLQSTDRVFSGHRPHAHALAMGADPRRLMAELAGRTTGYCGGRGGSMHIAAPNIGFFTATGIVGGNIPLALGAAWAAMLGQTDAIAVAIFGDGAGQTGQFHESMNLANLWQLPVVLLCENNGYVEFSPLDAHTRVVRLARHAETYGMPAVTIDGNDVLAVRSAVGEAATRARSGGGPTLVEALTYRLRGHYEGDPGKYRAVSEREDWRVKDPITRFSAHLAAEGVLDDGGIELQDRRDLAKVEVDRAVAAALTDPLSGRTEVMSEVYAS